MKKEIKSLKTSSVHQRFQSIYKTMLSHCLKCSKIQEVKTQKLGDSKRLRFIKQQEASRLLPTIMVIIF